jgi:hypothetical protein
MRWGPAVTIDVEHMSWDYDVFVSYSRHDERFTGLITAITSHMRDTFRSLTGRDLKLFVDTEEVSNASLWEERIYAALHGSTALIAMQTPSYLTSQWCAREWDVFSILEQDRRESYGLQSYESLIFPIALTNFDKLLSNVPAIQRRAMEMARHQCVDLVAIEPNTAEFTQRITRLTSDLIKVLQKVASQTASSVIQDDRTSYYRHAVRTSSTPLVATSPGVNEDKLTHLLAEARSATIVGISNTWVADCLERAMDIKSKQKDTPRFWDQLHIVFLTDDLLAMVSDNLVKDFPNRDEAIRERIRRAGHAKRKIMSLLLRNGVAGRWTLYSYPFLPPFVGVLFHMADGRRLVQMAITHPSMSEDDSLFIDFIDRVDDHFESAFREIVEAGHEEHEVVLAGAPGITPDSFICRSARFRRSVLVDGQNSDDWLAALVAVTWRKGKSAPEPLLQVNTPNNSTREMGKASHVSGYINQRDHSADAMPHEDPESGEFEIPLKTVEAAVRRELMDDFAISRVPTPPRFEGVAPFFYPDKENLFFYILEQELPAVHRFATPTQMFSWSVDELMAVRRHHALTNTLSMLSAIMSEKQRERALQLVNLNLVVQGEAELSDRIAEASRLRQEPTELISAIKEKIYESAVYRYSNGREICVTGLAGLQYRIFFSHLLPIYARLGIPGAESILSAIAEDQRRADSLQLLHALYSDRRFMESLPIEV